MFFSFVILGSFLISSLDHYGYNIQAPTLEKLVDSRLSTGTEPVIMGAQRKKYYSPFSEYVLGTIDKIESICWLQVSVEVAQCEEGFTCRNKDLHTL